jgi:ABC-type oligopeptide transport system substrate-binding subunit
MIARIFLLIALIGSLGGCAQSIDNEKLRADLIEDTPLDFNIGRLPLPEASAYLRGATAQGLVTFDEKGRIIPALASRWIITDDGMSYIFRLQKTKWNDGIDVTSDEVARILNMRFRELRGSRFSNELTLIDKSVAMTGKVVEIRLKAPMPNLLEIIAQPEFGLVRKAHGTGPMQAKRINGAMRMRMRGINNRGKTILENERIDVSTNIATTALARFKNAETDMVSGGRFQHVPLLEAANLPNRSLRFDPVPGLFGLAFAEAGPFLSERSNREAIAMAIDRPKMLSSFGILAWQETITIVPETMQNRDPVPRPDWAAQLIDQRKDLARQTIKRWKNANGSIRPLRIGLPRGPGSRILFARLQSDLAAIGLQAQRVTLAQEPDLQLIDRVADMSTPSWYLGQLSCRNLAVCSEESDSLVAQAHLTRDNAERQRLLGEAEIKLQSARNFIPLSNPVRWSVTRDGLLGFAPNARGWHFLQYLGRDTK